MGPLMAASVLQEAITLKLKSVDDIRDLVILRICIFETTLPGNVCVVA